MNERYVPLRRIRGPRWMARPIFFWLLRTRRWGLRLRDEVPEPEGIPYWPDAQIQIMCVQAEDGRDRIVGAVRTDAEAMEFEREHLESGREGRFSWIEMQLQGSDGYHSVWPNPEVVFIVSDGGLGDDPADEDADATVRGVFTDLAAAEEYLREDDAERPDYWPAPEICRVPLGRRLDL